MSQNDDSLHAAFRIMLLVTFVGVALMSAAWGLFCFVMIMQNKSALVQTGAVVAILASIGALGYFFFEVFARKKRVTIIRLFLFIGASILLGCFWFGGCVSFVTLNLH